MKVYREVGLHIRSIFKRYTDKVEPVSIDEAYLDVTEPKRGPASGTLLARAIKQDVLKETGLTVSVGVAAGKFYAKLASGIDKLGGLTVITPEDTLKVLADLPVDKFHGVGPVTANKLIKADIHTGADLKACPVERLEQHLGSFGVFLHAVANGIDERPVKPRVRKSYGSERTVYPALRSAEKVFAALAPLCEEVANYLGEAELQARTLTLKLKDVHYRVHTRSVTPVTPLSQAVQLRLHANLLLKANRELLPVKLAGISVKGLEAKSSVTQPVLLRP